jgi:hypothetical protein
VKRSIRSTEICVILVALSTIFSLAPALCDSASSNVYEREDLYSEGLKAYKANDYVTALKDLFAFQLLNEKQLQAATSEDLKNDRVKLAQAIADSETQLHSIVEWAQHRGGWKLKSNASASRATVATLSSLLFRFGQLLIALCGAGGDAGGCEGLLLCHLPIGWEDGTFRFPHGDAFPARDSAHRSGCRPEARSPQIAGWDSKSSRIQRLGCLVPTGSIQVPVFRFQKNH